jgi:hypothetical protein
MLRGGTEDGIIFSMKTSAIFAAAAAAASLSLCGGIVSVPAGETRRPVGALSEGAIVKEGEGVLDLSAVPLDGRAIVIREGTVRFSAAKAVRPKAVKTRHLRWTITGTRPNAQFSGSGPQFSEFRLFFKGAPVKFPAATRSTSPKHAAAEGADKGFDGNLSTKCYQPSPFVLDFGEEVEFDAYSFATANDAPGRDPRDWVLETGERRNGRIFWRVVGVERGFDAPAARFAEAGRRFQTAPGGSFPFDCAIEVCGRGRLVLDGVGGRLGNVKGGGLVELVNASATFPAGSGFTGSVVGGRVTFEK